MVSKTGPLPARMTPSASCWQLVRSVQNGMQNIDDTHGLSGSQLWALWQISARPGLRVSQLASALHIRPSTASNLLDKLEARQLVRRERRDTDNRVVRLHLTDEGAEVIKDIPGPMQGQLRGAWGKCRRRCWGICARGWRRCSRGLDIVRSSCRRQPCISAEILTPK
ncbi:MarR family transcriptional regulator [Candidatus Accumulibacter sp. ACC005]|uniref:MarR family winged helix-turn-helix transcriptional regulator n=1 Tax=Candidatus Accumulibacter sp. ACC005 TaxID=2823331 RepID=UPI0025C48524|nr:MarR family transcriptional regulator [Candidatus Accumulibacter sp. ACC005]